jgi:hypothetical protein
MYGHKDWLKLEGSTETVSAIFLSDVATIAVREETTVSLLRDRRGGAWIENICMYIV